MCVWVKGGGGRDDKIVWGNRLAFVFPAVAYNIGKAKERQAMNDFSFTGLGWG